MKTKVLRVAFVLGVLLFSAAGSLMADDSCMDMCMRHKGEKMDLDEMIMRKFHMILENEKELGLTAQQVDALKKLKIKTKKDLIVKDADIEMALLDIKSELWKDTINVTAVDPMIDKKYDIKKEKAKTLVAALANIKSTLSKDQMAKLKTMYNQRCDMCGRKRMACGAMMEKYADETKNSSEEKEEKSPMEGVEEQ